MGKKIYESIIDRIAGMIEAGDLSAGDRLPPERELAKAFDVSRNTVREAIKTLAEKKVLESRTGSGTYVSASGRGIIKNAIDQAFENRKIRLKDIFELRKILEPQIAFLAAERITPEVLADLMTIFDRQKTAFEKGQSTRDLDEQFHQTLARSTGNTVLFTVYEKLQDLFSESRDTGLQTLERSRRSVEIHAEILKAIVDKDPREASKRMKHHMQQIQKSLKSLEKSSMNTGKPFIKETLSSKA